MAAKQLQQAAHTKADEYDQQHPRVHVGPSAGIRTGLVNLCRESVFLAIRAESEPVSTNRFYILSAHFPGY